jgi:hypothetical protein
MATTKQQAPTALRMPADLKDWIRASAEANRRSINSEIVMLLVMAKNQVEKAAMKS